MTPDQVAAMRAADRAVRAWTNPGPHPDYHRAMVARLERDWPTLAQAMKELAAQSGRQA